jgi:hypothetical protein
VAVADGTSDGFIHGADFLDFHFFQMQVKYARPKSVLLAVSSVQRSMGSDSQVSEGLLPVDLFSKEMRCS